MPTGHKKGSASAVDAAMKQLAAAVEDYKAERAASGQPVPESVLRKRLLFALRANGVFALRRSIAQDDHTLGLFTPDNFAATEGMFEYLRRHREMLAQEAETQADAQMAETEAV